MVVRGLQGRCYEGLFPDHGMNLSPAQDVMA
jgi:hypothetical protein